VKWKLYALHLYLYWRHHFCVNLTFQTFHSRRKSFIKQLLFKNPPLSRTFFLRFTAPLFNFLSHSNFFFRTRHQRMCFVLCEFSVRTLRIWMKQWHNVAGYISIIINFVIGRNFKQNVIWIPLLWKRSLFVSRVNDSRIRILQLILFVFFYRNCVQDEKLIHK
jgi:hypothetical protein